MKGYAKLIISKSEECSGDYKILIAIAGNESGFGLMPYKAYNPFGYMNGVQYNSWSESLSVLSCTISQKFIKPCNNDLTCIVNKYGGVDTNKTKWIENINFFRNQIN